MYVCVCVCTLRSDFATYLGVIHRSTFVAPSLPQMHPSLTAARRRLLYAIAIEIFWNSFKAFVEKEIK